MNDLSRYIFNISYTSASRITLCGAVFGNQYNILVLSFIYITYVYLAYYLLGMSIAATYQWLFGLPCAPFN